MFHRIDSQLADAADAKSRLYPVLCLRFWCHAHIYFPVFSLIFYYIIHDGTTRADNTALTLLQVSLGSLSFAFFDSYGGAYADKYGCKNSIGLGLKLMIAMMVFFGAITLVTALPVAFAGGPSGKTVFIVLWTIGQLVIGLPLALIDGADTQLTRDATAGLGELKKNDRDYMEGICTKLKYSGVAFTSFVGCLLYVIGSAWFELPVALIGMLLFLLTISGQAIALRHLWRVPDRTPAGRHGFREAVREIVADKVVLTWVLIIAVTEGWLLFATYYFQLHALRDLIDNARSVPDKAVVFALCCWSSPCCTGFSHVRRRSGAPSLTAGLSEHPGTRPATPTSR